MDSSQAIFPFAVQKGRFFLRWLVRAVITSLRTLFAAVLRVIVTSVVFAACVVVMLHYLGVPMPAPSDLLDKFESLGRLTQILS
jgi:ABC-type multidrug transport system permease subunit